MKCREHPPLDDWIPRLIEAGGDDVEIVYGAGNFGANDGRLFDRLARIDEASVSYGVIRGLTEEELRLALMLAIFRWRSLEDGFNSQRALAQYVFKAMDLTGQEVAGEVDAESRQGVEKQLKARGLIVLEIAEKPTSKGVLERTKDRFRRTPPPADPRAARERSSKTYVVKAVCPLAGTIRTLEVDAESKQAVSVDLQMEGLYVLGEIVEKLGLEENSSE